MEEKNKIEKEKGEEYDGRRDKDIKTIYIFSRVCSLSSTKKTHTYLCTLGSVRSVSYKCSHTRVITIFV
jgi:hypothetical protein